MSALARLRAWLRTSDQPDRVTEWLPDLHADTGPLDRAEAEIVQLRRKVTELNRREAASRAAYCSLHEVVRAFLDGERNARYLRRLHAEIEADLTGRGER